MRKANVRVSEMQQLFIFLSLFPLMSEFLWDNDCLLLFISEALGHYLTRRSSMNLVTVGGMDAKMTDD